MIGLMLLVEGVHHSLNQTSNTGNWLKEIISSTVEIHWSLNSFNIKFYGILFTIFVYKIVTEA